MKKHLFVILSVILLIYISALANSFYFLYLFFKIFSLYALFILALSLKKFDSRLSRQKKVILRFGFLCIVYCGFFFSLLRDYFTEESHAAQGPSCWNVLENLFWALLLVWLAWFLTRKLNRKFLFSYSLAVTVTFSMILLKFIGLYEVNIEQDNVSALLSLPYLNWSDKKSSGNDFGVVFFDKERAHKGPLLYSSVNYAEAYLIDPRGKRLHKWEREVKDDYEVWSQVFLSEKGDLYVFWTDEELVKLNQDSRVEWMKKLRVHHDMAISEENNEIYVLCRRTVITFYHGLPLPVLDDYILVLSPDGEIKEELLSFRELLASRITFSQLVKTYIPLLDFRPKRFTFLFDRDYLKITLIGDFLHANSLDIIKEDINGLCRKGDILVSVRNIDLVAIIDREKNKIIWEWGPGELQGQHCANFLKNRNILIFDNGVKRRYSRVIELDPFTKKIVWQYAGNSQGNFFSQLRGFCQRLAGGNTLIVESAKGRIFEISRDGDIVWDFYNPQMDENNKRRSVIHRAQIIEE